MAWRYYFPGEGETTDDARDIKVSYRSVFDHEHAAQIACEFDYSKHDGWERGESQFEIAVISPTGEEMRFDAWHEPSVDHRVSKK